MHQPNDLTHPHNNLAACIHVGRSTTRDATQQCLPPPCMGMGSYTPGPARTMPNKTPTQGCMVPTHTPQKCACAYRVANHSDATKCGSSPCRRAMQSRAKLRAVSSNTPITICTTPTQPICSAQPWCHQCQPLRCAPMLDPAPQSAHANPN